MPDLLSVPFHVDISFGQSTEPGQDKKTAAKKPHLGKFVFEAVGVAPGVGIPVMLHALESPTGRDREPLIPRQPDLRMRPVRL